MLSTHSAPLNHGMIMGLADKYNHVPVLAGKVAEMLVWNTSGTYVDGTIGGGGHARAILERLGESGRLIGLDRDSEAVGAAGARLARGSTPRVEILQRDFTELASVLEEKRISRVDGLILDLGISSYQVDTPDRGFSFQSDGPLDMRMDRGKPLTAAHIVNESSRDELERIIREYGEERQARGVANAIVRTRDRAPLTSTARLADTIRSAVRRRWAVKSCARVFQALRIAVNQELDKLKLVLDTMLPLLSKRGRFGIISYHSLEDRLVKRIFETWASDCICPPGFPQCVCQHRRVAVLHTKRAVVASREEVANNPRARSARFRMIERLPDDQHAHCN